MKVLVTGGSGRTGRLVAEAAAAAGLGVRAVSRSAAVPFDWDDRSTWAAALDGVDAAYLAYYSDIGAPTAADAIGALARQAVASGVRRLVLLSARGEELALPAERALGESGADWTILRCSWFAQNFSEGPLLEAVRGGELAFPAGEIREPFIDARDIADVVVTALTDERHSGRVYELTGPRLLTWREAVAEVSRATGQEIHYVPVPVRDYATVMREIGMPDPEVEFLTALFTDLLDGHNARLADGVRQVLGREPRDFTAFARTDAAAGTWKG
ncbi:NmrA family NAD(P)-binding protein [Streptomyces apocyni]|uniref:NmrA family NAD(P)-binding protein n=1 Tax=Streptomyces apocyni TaxID=2654677 RepID=UPI0012EAF18B|nr:NAD(P)H-binding protein [Streptomyces apocyni]